MIGHINANNLPLFIQYNGDPKLVNRKGQLKSSLVFDEFPTIYIAGTSGIEGAIATTRGNCVCTCLLVQDISQLRKDYGKESADECFYKSMKNVLDTCRIFSK